MVIKKIFEGTCDDEVHSDFLKFGRGEYKDKYLIEGKKQAKGWTIKTGPEFANFLVKKCLEKVSGEIEIKGIIVTTQRLEGEKNRFEIKKVSNFQGVRKLQIDTTTPPEALLSFMEEFPRAFYALSFSGSDFTLKIKAKAPTSGKPGKESEEGPKAEFCSLKTKDKSLVDELFFDTENFKEAKASHTINITGIIYPSNVSELKPTEVREQAKRKGTITRIVTTDGKETITQKEFVA